MTDDTKARILTALETVYSNAADNAHRARASFRGLDTKGLMKEYGESGRTCGNLLASYEREEREALAALKEFDPSWQPRRMFTKED